MTCRMWMVGLSMLASAGAPAGDLNTNLREMEAAAERILQSGDQFQADLKKAREERAQLLRKQEEQRARQLAADEAARQAEAKQRTQARKVTAPALQKSEKIALSRPAQAETPRQPERSAVPDGAPSLARPEAPQLAQEPSQEEKMARAQAALAQIKAQSQPKAFEADAGSPELSPQDKAAKARAALEQVKRNNAPKAFE